ncbi:MAG: asparagine synthase (glutamine-hydrolyzing) [Thermodesulfobacteriota bacterium]
MCGIAGFISFHGHAPEAARSRVKAMADVLVHRGPDEAGVYVDYKAALGHRRLSIIDLVGGQQPMATGDGRFVIVFNGEIYNYRALRSELANAGHRFATSSDTEVLLAAYCSWGQGCLERLNGMFAFAIWDRTKSEVFLARDRLGQKPLFYFWDGRQLAFASELKSLLAGNWSAKRLEPRALDCFFSLGYVPAPLSIFTDVHKVEPARGMLVSANGVRSFSYWAVSFAAPVDMDLETAADRFSVLFDAAVKARRMSEVPLGAFLSGGLDSNLVVAGLARTGSQPVLTNTISFAPGTGDDAALAQETACRLGTNHAEWRVSPEAADVLPQLAWYADEPFADSSALPTWYVCQMARQRVTVALSGDGGDEGFGGYTFRYRPHMLESQVRNALPSWVRGMVFGGLGALYPGSRRLPRFLRLKTFLENLAVSDVQAFYQDLVWLHARDRQRLYAPGLVQQLAGYTPMEAVFSKYAHSDAPDALGRAQHADLRLYMAEDVLAKVDRMSMAHSLEVRSPFMDHRLVEFAATLPSALKVHRGQGKRVLRQAASRHLPPAVVEQPKQGFSIPAAQWLRGELKDMARAAIFESHVVKESLNSPEVERLWQEHQTKARDHNVFLWGLMMLGLWEGAVLR